MKKLVAAFVILSLLIPTIVLGTGSDHLRRPVSNENWPKGLAELVNGDNWVHGYWVNFEDVFFFKGDTGSLNDFIAEYAQLAGTKLHVVIHAGRLQVRSPWDEQPRDIEADWRLYASPFTRDQVQAGGIKPGPFVTRIDVWLGSSIELDKLQIPRNVTVDSGGEIEAFVKRHGQRGENE